MAWGGDGGEGEARRIFTDMPLNSALDTCGREEKLVESWREERCKLETASRASQASAAAEPGAAVVARI